MGNHLDDANQQADNYVDMSVAGPIKYVTRPVNWMLLRSLIVLPFLLIIGFATLIVGFILFSYEVAFLIVVLALGVPVGLFLSWAISSMILVALFGATCKAKSMAIFLLTMGLWPACIAMSLMDTLPFLLIPHDYSVYVFILIVVGAFVFGLWWAFKIPDDADTPIPLRVHAQSIAFVMVLVISAFEAFYPYSETVIKNVVFDECEVKKYRTKHSARTESATVCRARFEENGVERKLYLSRGDDKVIRIRHGLFDHYRSKFSD